MTFVFHLLNYLPLVWLHRIGAAVGWASWLLSPTYRQTMHRNMVQALGDEGERRFRRAAIAHAGMTSLELPRIWLPPVEAVASTVVAVTGWEVVEAAESAGKGIIYLTPHLGCFEVTGQYLSVHAPLTALYRPPKRQWLQKLVEIGRIRRQMRLAPADFTGVRLLLKSLKRGEAIAILPDQAPRKGDGKWLDFFGRPAYTMTLAARLSESAAAVVMMWAERLPGGKGFHLRFQQPQGVIEGTTEERAQQINHEIEALIVQCPEQYLWGYNRYKRRRGTGAPVESD